jgi:hypothetical protein
MEAEDKDDVLVSVIAAFPAVKLTTVSEPVSEVLKVPDNVALTELVE